MHDSFQSFLVAGCCEWCSSIKYLYHISLSRNRGRLHDTEERSQRRVVEISRGAGTHAHDIQASRLSGFASDSDALETASSWIRTERERTAAMSSLCRGGPDADGMDRIGGGL